jgi:hypothetical protein
VLETVGESHGTTVSNFVKCGGSVNEVWMEWREQVWSVTGCRHYVGSILCKSGDLVQICKRPIPNHPWNIAVYVDDRQIGTLCAARIKKIYEHFPSEGICGRIESFVLDSFGRKSQVKVRIL